LETDEFVIVGSVVANVDPFTTIGISFRQSFGVCCPAEPCSPYKSLPCEVESMEPTISLPLSSDGEFSVTEACQFAIETGAGLEPLTTNGA
jgi:hypothetical protein